MSALEKIAEKLKAIVKANPKGRPMAGSVFYPDPTPVAPPVGYVKQPHMIDIIRDQIRRAGEDAARAGFESFEDADDFDVDDDFDPKSPYELIVEQARPDGPVLRPEDDPAAVVPGRPGQPGVQGAEPPASGASPPEPRPSPQPGGAAPGGG